MALIAYGALAAGEANAQATEGDEIVVTAQRRAERAVDVPIAITTIGSDQLETANVNSLAGIASLTPSLRFDTAAAFSQPTIRGVGTSMVTSGGGSNVGIYVDGFYSPNPLVADFQLLNVQGVQVLKGPQGTLFGRNSTGGAILVQTADPSTETAARIKASYGRFNEARAQGYLTFGLSDKVALDVEGLYDRGDGWSRDIATGSTKGGDYENYSVRLGMKAQVSDDASILLRYIHNDNDDPRSLITNAYRDPVLGVTVSSAAPPSSYTTEPDAYSPGANPRYFRAKSNIVQGTIRADLGFANFASYSQYRSEKVDTSNDSDRTALPIFQIGLPIANSTWTQEFLLTSQPGGRLQWTAGLFYFSNRDTYTTFVDTNRATVGRVRLGGSGATTRSYAAFLDATYEIAPRLFLTAGARYSHDTVSNAYYNVGANRVDVPSIDNDKITPRVVLRYKPSDISSIYASFSKGYKAAIIDVGGSCQNPPALKCNDVQPEKINSYEIGYKYDDRRISLELSGYYYDYKNLQVSLFLAGRANVINAASSKIYGLDGQVRFQVSRAFDINAGASWTHARYDRFENAPIYRRAASGLFEVPSGITLTDVTMQRTPEFTGNIGGRYRTPVAGGELALSGNLYYTSKFFFGPSGVQFPQKGYETLALRAQWTDPTDRYAIAVWGDNVTNSRYLTAVQYGTLGIGANWSKPTTYGVEASVKF